MHVKTPVEEEIRNGLRGNYEDQIKAINYAYERFADPLAAALRERWAVTLDASEIKTAVNDVFVELAKKAKEGKFKADGSLASLLFTMAKRNAQDQWRQKYAYQRRHVSHCEISCGLNNEVTGLSEDEIASRVAKKLFDSPEVASTWKSLTQLRTPADEAATNEIVRQFKIWLGTLPGVQRKVAEVMALHFGDITENEILEELTGLGHVTSLGSVKSARKEIIEKFEALMQKHERINTP